MSMRDVAIPVVLVAATSAIVFGLVVFTGADRAPSAAECVDDWNGRAGSELQHQIALGEFQSATARGWLAKTVYPGCTVIFTADWHEHWLACVRTFHAADGRLTHWSCEGGSDLDRGRSEAMNANPNAAVDLNGRLVLQIFIEPLAHA